MKGLSLRLPDSLHRKVREIARSEGVSLNLFITTAVAEKVSALLTAEYLEERARRGSRNRFDAVMKKVKDRTPGWEDKI